MRISDWSSDVCSSDLLFHAVLPGRLADFVGIGRRVQAQRVEVHAGTAGAGEAGFEEAVADRAQRRGAFHALGPLAGVVAHPILDVGIHLPLHQARGLAGRGGGGDDLFLRRRFAAKGGRRIGLDAGRRRPALRSEEHTSELQSLMRTSYAVFCLNKKTTSTNSAVPRTQHSTTYPNNTQSR